MREPRCLLGRIGAGELAARKFADTGRIIGVVNDVELLARGQAGSPRHLSDAFAGGAHRGLTQPALEPCEVRGGVRVDVGIHRGVITGVGRRRARVEALLRGEARRRPSLRVGVRARREACGERERASLQESTSVQLHHPSARWDSTQRSMRSRRIGSETPPPPSMASWKARRSKRGPSFASASRRSARISV